MRALLLSALVASVPAVAQVYEDQLQLKLCFAHPGFCPEGHADLLVTDRVLTAPFGVRHPSTGAAVMQSAAVRIDEPFVVTDRRGLEFRVWVRPVPSPRVQVEVRGLKDEAPHSGPLGRFVTARVQVGDVESSGSFGVLTLFADGRYRLGSAGGHYAVLGNQLTFQGAIAHWGEATLSADGGSLAFTFGRGGVNWRLRFDREPPKVPTDSLATR